MKAIVTLTVCIIVVSSWSSPARGGFLINVTEVGGDVLVDGSGTFDLTGLALAHTSHFARIKPNEYFVAGPPTVTSIDFYQGMISGPPSFGFGTESKIASTGTGELFGLHFAGNIGLAVPDGYVSGTELSANSIYSGHTLSSLGLTPGDYSWTFGQDTIQVSFVSIPEPTSVALFAVAAGVSLLFWVRKTS